MIDLSTRYLGLQLANPLVLLGLAAVRELDDLRRMEDAGAGAVVLHSLFEEQIDAGEPRPRPLPRRTARRATPSR